MENIKQITNNVITCRKNFLLWISNKSNDENSKTR